MDQDEFSWEDKTIVVFKSTRGVAVYLNPDDDVVIRQQAGPLDNDDAILVIPRGQLKELVIALQNLED
jgi:hypothetical protein